MTAEPATADLRTATGEPPATVTAAPAATRSADPRIAATATRTPATAPGGPASEAGPRPTGLATEPTEPSNRATATRATAPGGPASEAGARPVDLATEPSDRATVTGASEDPASAVGDLLAGLIAEPWGQVTASVYETARLVALAPWRPGHAERLRWLRAAQRADGGWGPPGDYAIVPTLSATDALLSAGDEEAARRGIAFLSGRLHPARPVPDTPAADLIVAALIERIAERTGTRLPLPAGVDGARLARLRRHVRTSAAVPSKLLHALEVLGPEACRAPGVHPIGPGTVGASPAATAAWLGTPPGAVPAAPQGTPPAAPQGTPPAAPQGTPPGALHGTVPAALEGTPPGPRQDTPPGTVAAARPGTPPSVRLGAPSGRPPADRDPAPDPEAYLAAAAARHGGPVPCATPITVFERAWVLGGLARAGVELAAPPGLVADLLAGLTAGWGPDGTAAGPGLPADADTTAVVLFALAELGRGGEDGVDPGVLQVYDAGEFFCTWPGEDGFSVTTNAHVLDAFGIFGRHDIAERISQWLCRRQEPDGRWQDRWHASPYYATVCCVLALARFGRGPAVAAALARAAGWVAATQRPDGSWGCWQGTAEETAYAVQTLLTAGGDGAGLDRAERFLAAAHPPDLPMWHDKDLYAPHAIVRAAVLAARHSLRRPRNWPNRI